MMEDLSAMIGSDNTSNERVMGKHRYGRMNDNGERLVDFCGINNLAIGGSLFPHKDIHKITWISPNGRDRSQIDYLMINGKWKRSLQDVRVRRGADVGSDHHPVTAMVKLKLQCLCQTAKCQKRFDVAKLKNPVQRQLFSVKLRNRFDALAMANDDANNHGGEQQWAEASVDDYWVNIVRIYHDACTTTLGFKQKTNKEWLSENTWNAINESKKVKCKS